MEEWRPITGYEGSYEVSNSGKIRGLDRIIPDGRSWKGRSMYQITDKDGYKTVILSGVGKKRCFKVHRLVADAFIENVFNKEEVNHIDEIKDNNNINNLEWVSRQENASYSLAKKWSFINPNGDYMEIINLSRYCTDNNLNRCCMVKVYYGTQEEHRGWKKAIKVDELRQELEIKIGKKYLELTGE